MTFDQLEELFYSLKINASPSGFHGFSLRQTQLWCSGNMSLYEATTEWLALSEEQAEAAEKDFRTFMRRH